MKRSAAVGKVAAVASALVLVGGYVAYQAGCVHLPGMAGGQMTAPESDGDLVSAAAVEESVPAPRTQPASQPASVRAALSSDPRVPPEPGQTPKVLMSGTKSASLAFTRAPETAAPLMPSSKMAPVFTQPHAAPPAIPRAQIDRPPLSFSRAARPEPEPTPPVIDPKFARTVPASLPATAPATQPWRQEGPTR